MTTIFYFALGNPGQAVCELQIKWTERLLTQFGTLNLIRSTRWEDAMRAVWRGEPFLIAAEPEILDRYLKELDPDEVTVLRDCAYFWLLTSSGEYAHRNLPDERLVALSWNSASQNVVIGALKTLDAFPEMKGLSKVTDKVRKRIAQISAGHTGPGCSVLILGPTGSGKERVAQALAAASTGKRKQLGAVSGAWLNMEPGMAMSELVGLERGREEERIPGLLKQFSPNTLFIDDFESCRRNVQETLLRIMSVPEGQKAAFRSVGAKEESETDVWLIFATNGNVRSFARKDFLYRFGARIVWLLPLMERPADFAAIAHAMWAQIWSKRMNVHRDDKRYEPLRTATVKHLYKRELDWDGNVRTVSSLLKLVVAEMCEPSMNSWSQSDIIDTITANGPGILDWVSGYGIRLTRAAVGAMEEPCALEEASPLARKVGASGEADLKNKLLAVLDPRAAALVGSLEQILTARVRPDDGSPMNTPGRHLFYAALLFLAQKNPPRKVGSQEIKNALGISTGYLQHLCKEMKKLLQGPLSELCICSGGDGTRFSFEMPSSILRSSAAIAVPPPPPVTNVP